MVHPTPADFPHALAETAAASAVGPGHSHDTLYVFLPDHLTPFLGI